MSAAGILLLLAGVWLIAQTLKGDLLKAIV